MLNVFDPLENFIGDQNRAGKLLAAMHNTVANGGNFIHGLDHADLFVGQSPDNQLDSDGVIRAIVFTLVIFTPGNLVRNERITDTDPLDDTLGDNFATLPAVELVFYG
jgi:hypothetical protein